MTIDDEEKKKQLYVYDLETYPNFFLATFKNVQTKEWKEFEISNRRNDSKNLYYFLKTKGLKLIGFNNLNFDYPILHKTLLTHPKQWSPLSIYKVVETIISEKYSEIKEKDVLIPQLDVYKIWHYDNKNKATSLKWLEFAMRLENVEDLPYAPGSILTDTEKDNIIKYCRNDIDATEKFYNLSSKHIEIRKFYSKHENINLINASEIKISKEIFSKHLSKPLGLSQWEVKKLRTERQLVPIKDTIFDYITFNDPVNQDTLNKFKSYNWVDTSNMTKAEKKKHSISFSVPYKNVIREYAIGGLHSFGEPGVYESDNDYILVDVDFASYYPHLSFRNKLHPQHIPEKIFNELYEGFYTERKNYPKSDPRNYVLKIILNGSYGLSKDKYAFLYDPKWQLQICINGQLILTLLTEKILNVVPDAQIVFENTDGAMFRVKRTSYNALLEACKEVEKIVNIPLETQVCKTIIARDVNNYINIIDDKTIKFKGCFEIDRDYHKNHSKRIVAIALANYYINGIPCEKTIINHINKKDDYSFAKNYGIYDFCLGVKMKGQNKLHKRTIEDFKIVDVPLSKMNRYYVSTDGYELIKILPPSEANYLTSTDKHKIKHGESQINIFDFIDDVYVEPEDRETNIEAGWKCTLFNKYINKDEKDYNLNYEYYINECSKIINAVNNEKK